VKVEESFKNAVGVGLGYPQSVTAVGLIALVIDED
jgi:hypothetical protein